MVHEILKKLKEDEQGSTDGERIKKGKQKKMKSKKVAKTKKNKKINQSDIVKVTPPEETQRKTEDFKEKNF